VTMPVYVFRCPKCERVMESKRSVGDFTEPPCPVCSNGRRVLMRMIPTGVHHRWARGKPC
jgi:putative FmdB family regulatory protein